jgi:hypothetical protein
MEHSESLAKRSTAPWHLSKGCKMIVTTSKLTKETRLAKAAAPDLLGKGKLLPLHLPRQQVLGVLGAGGAAGGGAGPAVEATEGAAAAAGGEGVKAVHACWAGDAGGGGGGGGWPAACTAYACGHCAFVLRGGWALMEHLRAQLCSGELN